MNWRSILPSNININALSFEECLAFKQYYDVITETLEGPIGFQVFHKFLYHLLFFTLCCVEEKKFPSLNRAWEELNTVFSTDDFTDNLLVYCWIWCDFPLTQSSNIVLIDKFTDFVLNSAHFTVEEAQHLKEFNRKMKASRLGLYESMLSTSTVATFRELFTQQVVRTVRCISEDTPGEIFLTRLISYLGDTFQMHNPKCYPKEYKTHVINMVSDKLPLLAPTVNTDTASAYATFMKFAGPYWMSCTHYDQRIPILSPRHFLSYYDKTTDTRK